MFELRPHPSLGTNNMEQMIQHAEKNKIDIFTGVPLNFILRKSNHQELLWSYTRVLFYISQLIISNTGTSNNMTAIKQEIYDESLEHFTSALEQIEVLEENAKIGKSMALDNFLKSKLVKSGINENNVCGAKNEVKEIFQKKGISSNPTMDKMIDSISDKLGGLDLSNGDLFQNMFSIAQGVAEEMKTDLEDNPEGFQDTLGALTEIFQDAMNDPDAVASIPPEFRNILNMVAPGGNMPGMPPNDPVQMGPNDIMGELDVISPASNSP